jgi:dipeptidyl aminopeptidase/acylaminoacyl peptidase
MVTLLPPGEQPLEFRFRRQTQHLAAEAWKKAALGREPTASILDAGIAIDRPQRSAQLCAIDVGTKEMQVLASGDIRHVLLSPDREYVAVLAALPPLFPGRIPAAGQPPASRLGIAAVRRGSAVRWVDGLFNPIFAFDSHPHRWSPRGTALAAIGFESAEAGSRSSVFLVSPTDLSVRKTAENLTASAVAWSDDEQLLVRARAPAQTDRTDWWSLPPGAGDPRNITDGLTTVPSELVATHREHQMIAIADGALWSFDLANGARRRLVESDSMQVEAFAWPHAEDRLAAAASSMIVRVREHDSDSLARIDLTTSAATLTNFPEPPKATTLAGYHPGRNLVVFAAPQDPDGTFLWTGAGGGSNFSGRIALNQQLAGIAGAERLLVDYRSTDGQQLKAMLLLPVGYEKGARYPLVTWVYPGYMIRSLASASDWTIINKAHQDNLHIFAGHGYAVLIPSMPGNSPALRDLSAGILPAVDRVIDLGIADPARLAVIGQSGGGSVTYGLITQTNRFKAAVAINGFANRLSAYGTFGGRVRYTDAVDDKFAPWGTPPWENVDRFAETNPIGVIDRVNTPLLIVHGDIDFIPIEQAEEVFTSLARLGRRVRFVRYWGESHGVDSPANVRDRWQQIFRWFDVYLRDNR